MSSINLITMKPDKYDGKYVDLLNDCGFKHVFGRDANKDIIIAFLNEIIPDRTIVDLEHIRNEQMPMDLKSKKSVFDLYCKTDDGSRIVVELQQKSQADYVDRAIYYSAFPIQNQVESGTTTYTFNAVYVVNILNFKLKELEGNPDVVSVFRFMELKKKIELSSKYTLIFIELPKFTNELGKIEQNNILDGFFYCFKHMQLFKNKPEELKQPIWTRLFNAAQFAAMNKHEQLEYIKEMNTERDIRNQISYARECGKAEGIAEGKAEGKAEGLSEGKAEEKLNIAKNMKQDGIDSAIIAKYTCLSVEEIEKL